MSEEDEEEKRSVFFLTTCKHQNEALLENVESLVIGTPLTKVKSGSRQYRRFFCLEDDFSSIKWTPSSKKSSKAKISLLDLKEVRPTSANGFSLIFGDEFLCMELLADSGEERNIWVNGLNYLLSLQKNNCEEEKWEDEKMRDEWLEEVFDEADVDKRGELNEETVIHLMQKLNEQICTRQLKQKILELKMREVNRESFKILFKQTCTRPDLLFLLFKFTGGRNFLSIHELNIFLQSEQGFSHLTNTKQLLHKYERSELARNSDKLLLDGFTQLLLLLSEEEQEQEAEEEEEIEEREVKLLVRIISGQQLPLPKGSSAKASAIDPFVCLQMTGSLCDISEKRTKTVSNQGNSPLFDESFEFHVSNLKQSSLRMLVLDDDFIGDDFIGQCSIRVSAIRPGFRHLKLFSKDNQPISNSTLFVHFSVDQLRHKRKKKLELKSTGSKALDDLFKTCQVLVNDGIELRADLDSSQLQLCSQFSLPPSSNFLQCLRVLTLRMASCDSVSSFSIRTENELISVHVNSEHLSANLKRSLELVNKILSDFYFSSRTFLQLSTKLKQTLHELKENEKLCKKKMADIYNFNLQLLQQECLHLQRIQRKTEQQLKQVSSLANSFEQVFQKEKEKEKKTFLTLTFKQNSLEQISNNPSPSTEIKLKSILKKF